MFVFDFKVFCAILMSSCILAWRDKPFTSEDGEVQKNERLTRREFEIF